MRRTGVALIVCMALAACPFLHGGAHGLPDDAQFFLVTELGNVFHIVGPPPNRPPGFDSAPFLNVHPLDTALSLTAGPAPGVEPVATFDEAGTVTELPEYDPGREWMHAAIVTDWGSRTDSMPLYANIPVGDLSQIGGIPYLGPAKVQNHTTGDLLEWCNAGPVHPTKSDGSVNPLNTTVVSCVDNHNGRNATAAWSRVYGDVLRLPSVGRAIIDIE